jgi:hypothetical protein
MSYLPPSRSRCKREPNANAENIAIHGQHVFIRRWTLDARSNVTLLEVLRHA